MDATGGDDTASHGDGTGSDAVTARRPVRWLAYLTGAYGLAMFTFAGFLVPLRARELGASYDLIGLIVGAAAIAPALLSVPAGAVMDRLGPKRALLLSAAAGAALASLFPLVQDVRWFLVLQPALGAAINLGHVASQGYITGLARSPEERVALTGRFSAFANIAQMGAPLLAGAAAQVVGFGPAMLVPAGYAAVFVLFTLALPATPPPPDDVARPAGVGLRSAVALTRIRDIQVALLLTFVRLWTSLIFYSFLPVLLVEHGMEPGVTGTVVAIAGLVAAMVAPTTAYWTRLLSRVALSVLGLGSGAVWLVLAPQLTTLPGVVAIPVLVGVGAGVSLPLLLSIISDGAPPGQQGVAHGLRNTVNQSAATAAPVVVGALISGLGMTLGFVTGGLAAAALLAAAAVLHRTGAGRPFGGSRTAA
jgi:MFS transporter, DHA1 family, inner membrane transport protein